MLDSYYREFMCTFRCQIGVPLEHHQAYTNENNAWLGKLVLFSIWLYLDTNIYFLATCLQTRIHLILHSFWDNFSFDEKCGQLSDLTRLYHKIEKLLQLHKLLFSNNHSFFSVRASENRKYTCPRAKLLSTTYNMIEYLVCSQPQKDCLRFANSIINWRMHRHLNNTLFWILFWSPKPVLPQKMRLSVHEFTFVNFDCRLSNHYS